MRNLSAIAGIGNKFKRRINKHLIIIQHLSNAALWRIAFAPYRKYLIRNTLVQAHSDSAPSNLVSNQKTIFLLKTMIYMIYII